MPLPEPTFTPPFNIVRCSHAVLAVTDLPPSRAFYEGALSHGSTLDPQTEKRLRFELADQLHIVRRPEDAAAQFAKLCMSDAGREIMKKHCFELPAMK